MSQRTYFTDRADSTLESVSSTVDADFDPKDAETVEKEWQWNDFFGTDEYVRFRATVAKPITQPYFHDGELKEFKKSTDELKQAQAQIDNLPWTVGHPPKKRVTNADQIRGVWADPQYNDGQQATLYVPANDTDALREAVSNDSVSVGFGGTLDWTDNTEHDAVQRDMAYDHIATVVDGEGRCSPEDGCELQADSGVEAHGHVHDDTTESHIDVEHGGVRTTATEEGGSDGMNPTFNVDDWVSWDWSGGTATGQIKSVHTDGPVSVDGTERDPSEKGEPVYKINHYDEQKGSFGNTKIAYESNLSEASDPRETETTDSVGCTECSYGPCSCGRHVNLSVASVVDASSLDELDLTPPQSAQEAAQTALDYREESDAMSETGWDRAEQLAAGEELTPADISDGTDGMANWWARHKGHTVSGDSLKRDESVDRPDDNSWIAGKGWGGISGMNWAMRMDEKITEIRNSMENDSAYTDATIMDVIEYDGLMGGDLDESEIPNEGYEPHYVFAADIKTDSSYPLVDADGNLRRGNVDAAFKLYGRADDEAKLLNVLAQANKEFANADGYSAPIDEDSLSEAMTTDDSFNTTSDSTMSDDNDGDNGDDPIQSPTEFYDGEPSVDDLAEDFTAVETLADSKAELESTVESLNDELQEYKVEQFEDRAERLCELIDRDLDTLVERFEDGELTIEEVNDKIEVAEEARSTEPTTPSTTNDSESTEQETTTDREISTTDSGRFDLRQTTKAD